MKVVEWYRTAVRQQRSRRYMLIGLLIVAFVGVDVVVYRWYSNRYNARAQQELAHCMEIVERALKEKQPALLEQARLETGVGYERYSRSSLAPYFLALDADLALAQGDRTKACALMERAVGALSDDAAMYGFYAVKKALMKIDSADQKTREAGMQELQTLAHDPRNQQREMAAYYLGLIAFDGGDRRGAEEVWKEFSGPVARNSVWARLAQSKLSYSE
ncbi:MAG: hypothetical protein JW725_03225 [Candidatus Babeliaceae bacterium]|nr:hypothetical protein [Candidatus Babeliaceae bacterium]